MGRHADLEHTGAGSSGDVVPRRARHAAPDRTISPPVGRPPRIGLWTAGVVGVLAGVLFLAGVVAVLVPQLTVPPAPLAQDMGASSMALPAAAATTGPDRGRLGETTSAVSPTPSATTAPTSSASNGRAPQRTRPVVPRVASAGPRRTAAVVPVEPAPESVTSESAPPSTAVPGATVPETTVPETLETTMPPSSSAPPTSSPPDTSTPDAPTSAPETTSAPPTTESAPALTAAAGGRSTGA
jgi:hypothetical protein